MAFPYKHVLFIGATSGIGKAMAERIVADGVKVTAVGRRKDALEELENAYPGLARGAALDITQLDKLPEFAKHITEASPDIDCLFLNAGMQRAFDFSKPESVDLSLFHAEMSVNYMSMVALTHAFLPFLIANKGPSGIIFTGTHLSIVPAAPMPGYSASKAALNVFAMCLREQLRDTQIKVTEIAAPAVKTELHDYMGVEVGRNFGMPLESFIEAAYQGLLSGDDTIAVGAVPGAMEVMTDIVAKRLFDDWSNNIMATKLRSLPLQAALRTATRCASRQQRHFASTPKCLTDGVYGELTEMRTRTPFIEAFRKQHNGDQTPATDAAVEEKAPIDTTPKRMSESFHKVILPLARDPWLLDSYINATGHIRLGTIFMDLDALAGVVAYKHTGDSVMTVTAAVDRITLRHPLTSICDLELSGQVTFATGRSSMEISLQVAKAPEEGKEAKEEDILLTCAFTMVSLDPATKKPVNISPLKLVTDQEHKLYKEGQENYNSKKELSKIALRKQTPNDEESDLIHALWLKQSEYSDATSAMQKPANAHYMSSSFIQSVQIMQPQYRNRHNFMIFGGFLLKSTFELAFTCTSALSHARPRFLALDPSTFANPVPVGSVLYMTAVVAYTEPGVGDSTRVQIRVDTHVRSVEHGEVRPTGQFNYTFEVPGELSILPQTYGEFVIYLDARRRAMRVAGRAGSGVESVGQEGILG
ncbi:hypothetical protein V493_04671 [Pseudogymnoascus sp. VKM F-4281 (FW-2241)]|nr:hypothetical protein V493_04671 [Pseudogymnoascus sp. VKM F-4281 (FW-2241)]